MSAPHTHPDIEVNFLVEGGFSYLHGGAITPVEANRFTVLWGGVPHQTVAPGIVGPGIWITLPLAWFLQWQLPHGLQDRLLRGEPLADMIEAMSSHRPYREGLGLAAALAQVRQEAGTLLDAQVVQACERVFAERGFIFEKA